jgi:hypothetical protein
VLADGKPRLVLEIMVEAHIRSRGAADALLCKQVHAGLIERVGRGLYQAGAAVGAA